MIFLAFCFLEYNKNMFLPLEKTKKKRHTSGHFFPFTQVYFFKIFQAYEGHSNIFKLKK
jgi:hypothetical protein